ncbi:hypothetical protein TUN199_02461 [Pyrenophora tritici-repentis]|nr:hypothetical protein PtrV1_00724 [Pyrenophora tritici-repentis]KAI0572508.1 hypothetical protein Alg215_09740 [Pyrenophora tritici-repentis]KAI0589820.1 hypothetical protein Alg130_02788 [Pyrenophora tritici-repentis]KAI0613501.1 hypothetical protein TUN205_02210 [Pyrenophora tritici-repentis]KAI0625496.1 hypothetical protein TUN199_02461 [Pyrenophora tritici-repentis]
MDGWSTAAPISGTDQNVPKLKRPNKVIPVPIEFRRRSQLRERDIIVNDVKTATGCEVIPQWDNGRIQEFGIVGSGAGLDKAVRYINEWISKGNTRSAESSAWAKMPAFHSGNWHYEEAEQRERERKQQFKEPVPEDTSHLSKVTIPWPVALLDQEINPRDIFKNKLEALDAIRTNNDVYIILSPGPGKVWEIEILGEDIDKVVTAEAQVQTVIEKIQTDAAGFQHTFNIILDDREGLTIILEEAEPWWPKRHDRLVPRVPRLLPHPLMDIPGAFRQDFLHYTQLEKLQSSFKASLEAVRYRKGSYDMAIRLGCLALSSKRAAGITPGTTVEKENFQRGIEGIFQLEVKRWLASDTMGTQILRALMSADHFLEPTKPAGYYGRMPDSLKATQPMFRGTWVFHDPSVVGGRSSTSNTTQTPLVIVQVDWTDDEGGLYEKGGPRYYRTEQGINGPKVNMDINLLELGESRGWHFALESLVPVPAATVSPVLKVFARSVRMKDRYDISSHEAFVVCDATPTIKKCLATSRSEIIYTFGIKKTSYKVEITGMWYPGDQLAWGLCVRHLKWATHLAQLERLTMGNKVCWGDTIGAFLPQDGQSCHSTADEDDENGEGEELGMGSLELSPGARDGIRILTDKLLQLSTMVSSVAGNAGRVTI